MSQRRRLQTLQAKHDADAFDATESPSWHQMMRRVRQGTIKASAVMGTGVVYGNAQTGHSSERPDYHFDDPVRRKERVIINTQARAANKRARASRKANR